MIGDQLRDRSRQFALAIVRFCLKLGQDDLGRLVRPQLLRAGTGVAANHRAASRSRSPREFASRLAVVIEEADEAEFWLGVLVELEGAQLERAKLLRKEAEELLRIFVASRSTVQRRAKSHL